ncbi:MAG: hypothetical protein RR555_11125 [Bacteroidales bacterium]
MKRLILFGLFLMIQQAIYAQTNSNHHYYLNNFDMGKVVFLDGVVSQGLININYVTNTIDLISDTGDTLRVNKERPIKFIAIQGTIFLKHNSIFYQVLEQSDDISLLYSIKLTKSPEMIKGAYGTNVNASSNVIAKSMITASGSDVNFSKSDKFVLNNYTYNLFLLKKGSILPASKKTFMKVFSQKKEAINKYLAEHNVQFNDNTEIAALFKYCTDTTR